MEMGIFRQLGQEFTKIIKSPKILIPILGILIVPILYSGMFVWAFWNPYGKTEDLPIAVTNLDKGAEFNNGKLNVGDQLVHKLKDNPKFDWHFVSKKTAVQGLKDNKYYMWIVIPDDFSKNASTVMSKHPKSLQLQYVPNKGYNFLASKIGETGMDQLKEQVSDNLTKQYTEVLFANIDKLSSGLKNASQGANQLAKGAENAKGGAKRLQQNLQKLSSGATTLHQSLQKADKGAHDLTSGLQNLHQGTNQMETALKNKTPQINRLAEGAQTLSGGLSKLNVAQNQLQAGAQATRSGAQDLHQGLQKTLSGTEQIESKVSKAAQQAEQINTVVKNWQTKINQVANGANKINQVDEQIDKRVDVKAAEIANELNLTDDQRKKLTGILSDLKTNIHQDLPDAGEISSGAEDLSNRLGTVSGQIAQIGQLDQALTQLESGQRQLVRGSGQLMQGENRLVSGMSQFGTKLNEANQGANKLAQGTKQIQSGWNSLVANVGKLNSGSADLLSGSRTLTNGLDQLTNGSNQIQNGALQLQQGSGQLSSGLNDLSKGSGQLANKLSGAANKTKGIQTGKENADMFSDPVKLNQHDITEVPNYGTGLAPYFLSLGLFVGALLMTIVFPFREPVIPPKSSFAWFLSKFGVLAVMGICQALIADVILTQVIGLDVTSMPHFIVFSIITSFTYIAMIQFLATTMGDYGRFIAIIILILQLTSSGGTYPAPLIPRPLQIFNHFLPMTFSIQGFRDVISSGNFTAMWLNAGMLFIYFAVFIIASIITFAVMFRKQYKTPSLQEEV